MTCHPATNEAMKLKCEISTGISKTQTPKFGLSEEDTVPTEQADVNIC